MGRTPRTASWSAVLLVVLLLVVISSLAIGARPTSLDQVASALFSPTGTEADTVVRDVRLPRTIVGLLAGAALGLGGALMQGHTRNALADPGILGVNAGAAFVVCLGISAFGITALADQVWLGLIGALAASSIVLLVVASRGREAAPVMLALLGTVITAILTALTSALLLLDSSTIASFRFWTVGSLAGRGLDEVVTVLPFLAVGTAIALLSTHSLNALALGEELAGSLGHRLLLTRLTGISAVALLTAAAVAMAGPLLFIGLIAPHIARGICGPDYRRLVPLAAVVGAGTVLAADVLGRFLLRPEEVQAGIISALIGGPLFIAFVRHPRRRAAL